MSHAARASSVLALLVTLWSPAMSYAIEYGLTEGKTFPDLRLPTLEGGRRSISSYRGQRLLLLVYASW